ATNTTTPTASAVIAPPTNVTMATENATNNTKPTASAAIAPPTDVHAQLSLVAERREQIHVLLNNKRAELLPLELTFTGIRNQPSKGARCAAVANELKELRSTVNELDSRYKHLDKLYTDINTSLTAEQPGSTAPNNPNQDGTDVKPSSN